jgi:methanogenic corrinoid protein MtbC1
MTRTTTSKEAPVSAKTKKGMTLTIDDRKFIKVQNDYIIDLVSEKMAENIKYIAEIVMAANDKMFSFMEEIREEIKEIKNVLEDHEKRIRRLEDCIEMRKIS